MEIHSIDELRGYLSTHAGPLGHLRLQSVHVPPGDPLLAELAARDVRGMLLLGDGLPAADLEALRGRGALVLPSDPKLPFNPFRAHLYTPDELYRGLDDGYRQTLDARCYAWSVQTAGSRDVERAVYAGLHDVSVSDALSEVLGHSGCGTVAVLGGHALERGEPAYDAAARLGFRLAQDDVVLTGGGPGAMEAANLGASYAGQSAADLQRALHRVAGAPGFDDITRWARAGFEARNGTPHPALRSVGIPTWHYGHEPPNVFARLVAKYFSNALREDILLALANRALIVLPGAAGTVQEIFQASVRNYYSTGDHLQTILVGIEHWTRRLPAWPLLQALAADREMAAHVHLVDDVDAAAELVAGTRG